jgi:hypothetical protein
VSASGEVRLVPVSREQRDMLVGASKTRWPEFSALVAAWDAAVPGVVDARAAAGGEAAAERSLASRGDVVWTVDDLPHLLDEPVERPSVSLRETIEAELRVRCGDDPSGVKTDILLAWCADQIERERKQQVKREAEEGERDE